ncbi:MAG: SMI1/KNR4 family protein [Phycisphaerales bacterium]|nr:SMI1/KNR4 family protein [Phycisphaerales bacterium]
MELELLAAELEKDPGVHALNRGAAPAMIDAAEAKLGVKFPDTYRRFLLRWNGGAMFGPEFHSLNLMYVSDGIVEESGMEVTRWNADRIAKGKRKIAIAVDGSGYETFLDLDSGEVATFDREEREWLDSSDSIGAWLLDEIRDWREDRE